jgi:catechol 2,3-dioxygenase-like lactoylglutathione lyase family enzyme
MSDRITQQEIPAGQRAGARLVPSMLSHVAWVTHDVGRTLEFYTKIMGMELASTVIDDRVPSTGDPFPYFHLFFKMGDGSTIAFFESPGLPARAIPSHPAYDIFDHIALQVQSVQEVVRWKEWLGRNHIEVIGPNDHDGLIMSIYFRDPNGIRMEITTPLDQNWNNHTEQAYRDVALWQNAKAEALARGRDVSSALIELTSRVRRERLERSST